MWWLDGARIRLPKPSHIGYESNSTENRMSLKYLCLWEVRWRESSDDLRPD